MPERRRRAASRGISWRGTGLRLVLFAAALSLPRPARSADDAGAKYRAEIETWRSARFERLRREDSWLTLVGLFWLGDGENAFGSDSSNPIVFPAGKTPAKMGSILLSNGRASVRADPSAGLTSGGKPVTAMPLLSDAEGDPTVLTHGSVSFYLIRRGDRLGVRVKDSDTAARREFRGIDHFPVDPGWRLPARFEHSDPPRSIPIPNVLGAVTPEPSPGAVIFEIAGKTYRLDAVTEEGSDELFLIFGDSTNGVETYGGGRFLYAPSPVNGRTVVDFNKSYNPPCVFSPYATCPLPPPQNKLTVRVEAGEKSYGEH